MKVLPLFLLVALAKPAIAQQADTTRVHHLNALVVTAERFAIPVALSTSSVSVLTGSAVRARPVRTLAEAVQQTPGLAFVDFDGLGRDPQLMVRGFYGGGEAEYVVVLLDGRPINDFETGRVPWDLVPLSAIESIEVVRGNASTAWGDAALGGVIRVTTQQGSRQVLRTTLAGGDHGLLRASGSLLDHVGERPLSLFGDFSRSDGYRTHSERTTGAFGATLSLIEKPEHSLSAFTTNDWRSFDEPGPLTGPELTSSPTQSSPFHSFDNAEERRHALGIEGAAALRQRTRLSGSLTGDYRRTDRIRTLPLSPEFADTKTRLLTASRVVVTAQLEMNEPPFLRNDHLLLGIDASLGRVTSEYYDFLQGPANAYANATPRRGDLDARGTGGRTAVAGFFHYAVQASPALRFTLGTRLDALRDTFEGEDPSPQAERSTTHVAFSPKVGANLRYVDAGGHQGNVYVSGARAFKAPTPDQLFDLRTIPVPFPPFAVSFANDELKPQYSTSIETGLYHRAELVPGALTAELSLAAYHMDLRDEVDFDLQTLSYQNIGKSRHRGIETGLQLSGPASLDAFANYTLQSPTSRTGEHSGNQLKAVPRHFVSAGITTARESGLGGSLLVSTARGMYLDDANTQRLPNWTRWDGRLSYTLHRTRLSADVFNLLDAEYATTGFPDPAGSDLVYFYPAAGRTLQISVTREW